MRTNQRNNKGSLLGALSLIVLLICPSRHEQLAEAALASASSSSSSSGGDTTGGSASMASARVQADGSMTVNPPQEQETDGHDENNLALLFPRLTYGTAWKKERTATLVSQAVHAGFRHIDTACQPRHYNEPAVGQGWTTAAQELGLVRDDFWLQTKYTSLNGQDPNHVPYEKEAPLDEQVRQSVAKSLENLQTTYIDSLVMHGPENSWEKNLLVWRTMETFVDAGTVGQLGISNFYDPKAVEYLYNQARIKPAVVQNRFYADSGFDVAIRKFCLKHGMEYQSFWTLGANRNALRNNEFKALAAKKGLSAETLMYAFVMAIGITPLDGTTNVEHMKEDMEFLKRARTGDIFNSDEEVKMLAQIVGIPDWTEENIARRI